MIWRRVMLAVPNVDYLPSNVVDRLGRIVRGVQAELELFSSLYEPDIVRPGQYDEAAKAIADLVESRHRRLERIADMFREQEVTVCCSVRWDYPMHEAVVRQVLRHQVDLLVVPARATGDIGQRTLHYREVRLIETCPCPLLLLKSPEDYAQRPIVAAVDPLHAYEVPEELDDIIIKAARTLAYSLAEAPVHLYHAEAVSPNSEQEHARRIRVNVRVRDLAERNNIPGEKVHIESGAVEVTLPEFARTAHADAIVMGVLSRAYPHRAILGHKAEYVLDGVSCDVLVVKPSGFTCSVDPEPSPAVPIPGLERQA